MGRGPIVRLGLVWFLVLVAVAACATPGAAIFSGNLGSLAGTWEGWIDYGPGMSRAITVAVEEDGSFQGIDSSGSVFAGSLHAGDGALHWTSAIAGIAGTAKVSHDGGPWILRGRRADGTVPFEWRRQN